MFDIILDLCRASITSAVGWFSHFADKLGFVSALLGLFLLYNVIRFLIIPLIGTGMSGFSDVAKDTFKDKTYEPNMSNKKKR